MSNWIEREIQKQVQLGLQRIKSRVIQIFKESIQQELYNRYNPEDYDRTYQMLESVDVIVKGNSIIVYNNPDLMTQGYKSAVDGTDVTPYITKFLQGHDDSSSINNMYHHYPQANYLEVAKQRIESELGLKCEIINER